MSKTPVGTAATETEETTTDETTETAEATTATQTEEDPAVKALRILESMQANNGKESPKKTEVPQTYSEIREKIKEETGWTDAQVDFHIRSLGEASASGKKLEAFSTLEEKFSDFKSLKGDINEELKAYPAAMQGDQTLIEKIYWMAKGKKMSTTPVTTTTKPQPGAQRRIAQGYPGFESGTDTSGGRGKATVLVGEEKELARRMGIPEDKWNKSKETRVIKNLREQG